MNRRDFLLRGSNPRPLLELSCETIYMRYVDAKRAGRIPSFLEQVRRELAGAGTIRLTAACWFDCEEFNRDLHPLVSEFVSRGARVEFIRARVARKDGSPGISKGMVIRSDTRFSDSSRTSVAHSNGR